MRAVVVVDVQQRFQVLFVRHVAHVVELEAAFGVVPEHRARVPAEAAVGRFEEKAQASARAVVVAERLVYSTVLPAQARVHVDAAEVVVRKLSSRALLTADVNTSSAILWVGREAGASAKLLEA